MHPGATWLKQDPGGFQSLCHREAGAALPSAPEQSALRRGEQGMGGWAGALKG